MARKRKSASAEWQQRRQEAMDEEYCVRTVAKYSGLSLTVSLVNCGRGRRVWFPHWQFRDPDGSIVFHYWPTDRSGKTNDDVLVAEIPGPHEALRCALEVIGEA